MSDNKSTSEHVNNDAVSDKFKSYDDINQYYDSMIQDAVNTYLVSNRIDVENNRNSEGQRSPSNHQ